jgi:COP9 signalosome complex subunit 12
LHALFAPLCRTIKSGNLQAFNTALRHGEEEFVRRRIYLTLERGKDIATRNLFRKVFLIGDKKTRVPVREFQIAMGCAGGSDGVEGEAELDTVGYKTGSLERAEVEIEEVECLLANLIYKGLMKGYISREKQMVVLSNKEAFPGTGC